MAHFESILSDICLHSSERERAAVACEREVESMKMAEYMEEHIGEQFEGMISGITSFGMFVVLDNLIEGLVPILSLDDYYVYDLKTESLIGQNTHNRYVIVDRVLIEVVSASKSERKIDFKVVKRIDIDEKEKTFKKKYS